MNCKVNNPECQNGWINSKQGYKICECFREVNIDKFYDFSDAPKKNKKRLNELEDQRIENGKGKIVSYKKSIEQLVKDPKNIQTMIDNDFRIVLKGNPGSGKTQYAITLATEILANYDLQDPNVEINKFYFLSIHKLSDILFDDTKKKESNYREKIAKSKVLIIDDIALEVKFENNKLPYMLEEIDRIIRNFEGIIIYTTNRIENLKTIYEPYNKRLASVILTDKEENHGENNSLFYTITRREDRRKKKNTGATFL